MFTGIIEDVGRVASRGGCALSLTSSLKDVKQGDSVSVNGICLTITKVESAARGSRLYFDFSPETNSRSNISMLQIGSEVNLERSLKVGDRFGGHIMTGHVEGRGKLTKKRRVGDFWLLSFSVNASLAKYIVPKGSVAVDGISLTVVDSDVAGFSVSIIPHTMLHTNLRTRKAGESVNIEPDILAKYVEHLLSGTESGKITGEFLREYGFER